MSIIEELTWRGAINQQTDEEGLKKLVEEKSVSLYCGVDPTADSLHIGHLIPYMVLKRFQLAGHRPVIVIGAGTATIGDPSGRNSERELQTTETIMKNAEAISQQMVHLFDANGSNGIKMVNNYDWLKEISFLDFLRDVGKDFSVNTMLSKESVQSRLETGISFTEFTYQIIQAMDYLHLYREHDVQLQVGGADQWGNITAGLDFIRKKEGPEAEAYGLTIPLLTNADGEKFGKSAGNAVWLDPEKTSPYEFYQFWMNQQDEDIVKYLKYFSFRSKEEIEEIAGQMEAEPHKRHGQRALAEEMTVFVHSQEDLEEVQVLTDALFSGDVANLSVEQVKNASSAMESLTASRESQNIIDFLVDTTGIVNSRRQAREDINNGAIYIKGDRITDLDYMIDEEDSYEDQFILVRRGKKRWFLVNLED